MTNRLWAVGLACRFFILGSTFFLGVAKAQGLTERMSGISSLMGTASSSANLRSPLELEAYSADQSVDDTSYFVGPGDQFQIAMEDKFFDKQVNAEGNIVLPGMGVVAVNGLTLKAAKQEILKTLRETNIQSQCWVNLGRPKMIRVMVTGAVRAPGAYDIQGTQRLSHLLSLAGWFSARAQKGKVRITSPGGQSEDVDLRSFFSRGDLAGNPLLRQGALVFVPFLDYNLPVVRVQFDSAQVEIQLEPEETVENILDKFFSFRHVLPVEILTIREKDGQVKSLSYREGRAYHPQDGAVIDVSSSRGFVYVGGAVRNPGFRFYRSGVTPNQYIAESGVLPSSKIGGSTQVHRFDGTTLSLSTTAGYVLPGDILYVEQNMQEKVLIFTPILMSLASLALTVYSLTLR